MTTVLHSALSIHKPQRSILSYKVYPWFEDVSVSDVYDVKLPHGSQVKRFGTEPAHGPEKPSARLVQ